MARINVYRHPGADQYGADLNAQPALDGWFDEDKADLITEETEWDGNNHRSVHTGAQFEHQALYRTTGGRWVLHTWSQRQGTSPTYQFVTDDTAREWLIRNEDDNLIAKYFGELEEERGPGRPAIGDGRQINIRLGDLLDPLDQRARDENTTRNELIRRYVAAGLAATKES